MREFLLDIFKPKLFSFEDKLLGKIELEFGFGKNFLF
jgi:hypothetical protein